LRRKGKVKMTFSPLPHFLIYIYICPYI
jgi:hypothetical protein